MVNNLSRGKTVVDLTGQEVRQSGPLELGLGKRKKGIKQQMNPWWECVWELQDGIGQRQTVVRILNATGEEIIQQSSKTDASILQEKLGSLNLRWQEVCKQLAERKKRLEEQKNILSEFQRDVNEFVLWLEEADNVANIPLEPGNEQQLKQKLEQVKLLAEELPLRQGILKQLNETGGTVLVSAPISPEEQDKLENKLKQTNLQWIKVRH
ncbi:dystrophin-partial [Lynx pardinus]|uniref:Dystrophin-partial n=1 Tax=Lynx pardinus TaxID=191816 RepID=A0A485MK49_LYNPA|nr:dystrophin-partial [Lynx pardinus]